jgi:ABC-2 type transport system permease protein
MIIINAMAVVRERERGTLEQLIVTPIDRTSLMLGKIIPFLLVGYVQMTVVILLGRVLFDVPLRGSIPLLYLLAFPFIVANLGLGLFFSTLVRNQAQAMQAGFLILPNTLRLHVPTCGNARPRSGWAWRCPSWRCSYSPRGEDRRSGSY